MVTALDPDAVHLDSYRPTRHRALNATVPDTIDTRQQNRQTIYRRSCIACTPIELDITIIQLNASENRIMFGDKDPYRDV